MFESALPMALANTKTRRGHGLWVRMLVVSVDRVFCLLRVQTRARAASPSHQEFHPLIPLLFYWDLTLPSGAILDSMRRELGG